MRASNVQRSFHTRLGHATEATSNKIGTVFLIRSWGPGTAKFEPNLCTYQASEFVCITPFERFLFIQEKIS